MLTCRTTFTCSPLTLENDNLKIMGFFNTLIKPSKNPIAVTGLLGYVS